MQLSRRSQQKFADMAASLGTVRVSQVGEPPDVEEQFSEAAGLLLMQRVKYLRRWLGPAAS